MTDVKDEVRELLGRKADHVPPHRAVPRSLRRRIRRRIALNALVLGTLIVVLGAGAFAGVRALSGAGTVTPANSPSGHPQSPSVQPSSSAATTAACTAGQLRAVASTEGAAGSREGAVRLENLSDGACTLQGTPTITLLDQNSNPITSGVTFVPAPAGWQAQGSPQPPGWPVVTLQPGDSASVRIRWGNWCPDGRAVPLWQMEIPGGGTVDVSGLDTAGPPLCNGQSMPSTVKVGPFEPGT